MTNNTTDFNLTFHQYMGLISTKLAFLEQLLRGTEYITYKLMTMETISKGAHLKIHEVAEKSPQQQLKVTRQ